MLRAQFEQLRRLRDGILRPPSSEGKDSTNTPSIADEASANGLKLHEAAFINDDASTADGCSEVHDGDGDGEEDAP